MKTYKTLLIKLFAVLFVASICACSDDDNDAVSTTPSSGDFNINRAETGVTFDQEAAILGITGDDAMNVAISLMYLIPNFSQNVTDSTKLLIVPELSKLFEEQITKVYNNGGVVAVTDPSQEQLTKWFNAYHWDAGIVPGNVDDALLFSFGKGFHCCLVYGPDKENVVIDSEDIENMSDKDSEDFIYKDFSTEGVVTAEEKSTKADVEETDDDDVEYVWIDFQNPKYPEVYNYLSSWIDVVNSDFSKVGLPEDEAQQVKQQFLQKVNRADNGGTQMQDVSEIFARYPYSIVAPFTAEATVRQLAGGSDPDVIKGTGAVTLSFNIYQIHCYADKPGAGDYYLVNMTAGLASADMYKGKWWNQHSGTYVRMCGFYAKEFQVECSPCHQFKGGTLTASSEQPVPYSSDEVETLETPKPVTTVGQTQYDDSFTFSVDASVSVSGGVNVMMAPYFEVNPKLSFGWNWSEQTIRSVSDTDISNISGAYVMNGDVVSKVGWKLSFNNLPEFDWWESRGFNEGSSLTYRSTNYLHANWVWHQKDVADDSTQDPIAIHVKVKPTYGVQSFISTYADWEEREYNFGSVNQVINLRPFIRDKCAVINLKNDLTENVIGVEVWQKGDKDHLVWNYKTTLKPDQKVTTAALKVDATYNIYVTTKSSTGDKKKYQCLNRRIEFDSDNNMNTSINFEPVAD